MNASTLPVVKPKRTALVLAIVFGLMALALGGACVWLTINYLDQKDNVDQKVDTAVAQAVKVREDELEANFAEREKEPFLSFVGPEDLGRLTFRYPKTWSTYVAKDGVPFEAYFHPKQVQPATSTTRYALRVLIEGRDYEVVLKKYDSAIKKGNLTAATLTVGGDTVATRLDGAFSKTITGSAVVFKLRDKTVTLRTDADESFRSDFDKLIQTIDFNK